MGAAARRMGAVGCAAGRGMAHARLEALRARGDGARGAQAGDGDGDGAICGVDARGATASLMFASMARAMSESM